MSKIVECCSNCGCILDQKIIDSRTEWEVIEYSCPTCDEPIEKKVWRHKKNG